ncbi:Phage tail tube protein, GTA-gp10 [Phyllobacterium sp. YR620]|uniref:gene transfer agent family protein n=1 Tax=Phyllobacterium sp. YR620 TaxID=1881066 RepID=UPI000884A62E|nr:gene transfer agent family protein [Phyllobacterium sp. YR620]SDP72499.1 Phage tail tube protein, GTA-gp10 [Phyllobacterium sp. YR620]
MPNRRRGEISANLDGRDFTLCLTLGALAELEDAFGAQDLGALLRRFAGGALSAGDLIKIIAAGLRGGGNDVGPEAVALMRTEGAAAGFATIVSELLSATFGDSKSEQVPPNP